MSYVAQVLLASAAEIGDSPRLAGDAEGDAVQPGAHRLPAAHRGRPLGQDQEHGLEGVLGVRLVGHDRPAHIQYHRSVTAQERVKRRLVALLQKTREQVRVGHVRQVLV